MQHYKNLSLLLVCLLLPVATGGAQGGADDRGAVKNQYPSQHRVRKGETLMSIARRKEIFNDPYLWPLIYKANRDQIRDPRIIFPGQVLSIPRNVTSEEIAEARRHACTPVPSGAPIKSDGWNWYLKNPPTHADFGKDGPDNQTKPDQ